MLGRAIGICLLGIALFSGGNAVYIHAKALLAQMLIASAWADTLKSDEAHPPWPWADVWPVARLEIKGRHLYVLSGAHGSALAFGPGHLDGSELPGEGHAVIAGHRDTHFALLRDINIGDSFRLQQRSGSWRYYRVTARDIVNVKEHALPFYPGRNQLQLVTCYPFDAINPGGPLRLSLMAQPL
ncbi:MAG: class GN sortase [Pseudomonadota bacterium]